MKIIFAVMLSFSLISFSFSDDLKEDAKAKPSFGIEERIFQIKLSLDILDETLSLIHDEKSANECAKLLNLSCCQIKLLVINEIIKESPLEKNGYDFFALLRSKMDESKLNKMRLKVQEIKDNKCYSSAELKKYFDIHEVDLDEVFDFLEKDASGTKYE